MPTNDNEMLKSFSAFLNDPCWMEGYGYKAFSNKEVNTLYDELKTAKKLNMHRQELAQYALKRYPHRSIHNKNPFYLLTGVGATAAAVIIGLIIKFS